MLTGPHAELPNRPRRHRYAAACVFLSLLVAGIQAHGLIQSRQDVEERTALAAQNLGSVLSTSMVGAFQNIDLMLQTVASQVRLQPLWADNGDPAFVAVLEELVHRTPGLLGLHVADATGKVKYGTGKLSFADVDVSDRPYFQKLRDNADSGMVVSDPVMGLIAKKWVLVCARRINRPDGQFGGVVYGSIEIEGMAERITGTPLHLGEHDIITMANDDMAVIMRYVDSRQDMQFVGQKRPVPRVEELVRSNAANGFFSGTSPFDQVHRIFYFQHIPERSMNLVVGLATEEAMAGWRRDALQAALVTVLFAFFVSLGSYLIYQGQMRRLRLMAELALSNRRLSELSTTDSLTGIANRRRFDELLDEEWRRGVRSQQSLALAMVDVDHFKAYNDRYGHQNGDECLRKVGQLLGQHIRRAGDFVARYGGEEFVVICAATDGGHARQLVEAMRAALDELSLPHELSPHGHVTISIGVAALVPDESFGQSALVRLADQALYAAKEAGRNRVVLGQ